MEIAPLGKRAGTEVGSAPHAAPPIRAKAVKSYYVAYWVLHCSVVCTACYVTNCHGVQRYVVCIHNTVSSREVFHVSKPCYVADFPLPTERKY